MTNEDMNSLMERYKKQLIEFEKRTTFPRQTVEEDERVSDSNIMQNSISANQSDAVRNEAGDAQVQGEDIMAEPVNSSMYEDEDFAGQWTGREDIPEQMTGPRPQVEIPFRPQEAQQRIEAPQRIMQPPTAIPDVLQQNATRRQSADFLSPPINEQRSGTVENEIHRPEFLNVPELSPSRIRTGEEEGIIRGQNLSRQNTPEASQRYRQYESQFNKKGLLRVETTASRGLYPVGNSRVVVYKTIDGQNYYIYDLFTDASGILDNLELPAPDKSFSTSPDDGGMVPYATYNVYVEHPGFAPTLFENVPVFDGIVSIQSVEMIPTVAGGTEPTPVRVIEREPRL